MLFKLCRRLLFLLPAETSHNLGLGALKLLHSLGLSGLLREHLVEDRHSLLGLDFANRVGLAAGLDKNGDYIDALGSLGFGFIEVGTITPRPQPGNPKPRLFRLEPEEAIINRMGFNNKGVDHLVSRLRQRRYRGIVGVNIGKNLDTPVERAQEDYLYCLRKVYAYADYITINLSSPNTPGLRSLQFGTALAELLASLKQAQGELAAEHARHVPLLVKIAPDLSDEEIAQIASTFLTAGVEGVIATNTTLAREGVQHSPFAGEAGGLSGKPLTSQATAVTRKLCQALGGKSPVIAAGGIGTAEDAAAKIEAGASLVQIYTGFIYHGPALLAAVAKRLASRGLAS